MSSMRNATPQQAHDIMKYYMNKEKEIYREHVATKGDGSGKGPFKGIADITTVIEKPLSYFNNPNAHEKHDTRRPYEILFKVDFGWDPKDRRSDRSHKNGLEIGKQEWERPVPVSANSEYGRRAHRPLDRILEIPSYNHHYICDVTFKRHCNLGIPLNVDPIEQLH